MRQLKGSERREVGGEGGAQCGSGGRRRCRTRTAPSGGARAERGKNVGGSHEARICPPSSGACPRGGPGAAPRGSARRARRRPGGRPRTARPRTGAPRAAGQPVAAGSVAGGRRVRRGGARGLGHAVRPLHRRARRAGAATLGERRPLAAGCWLPAGERAWRWQKGARGGVEGPSPPGPAPSPSLRGRTRV